MHPLPFDTLAFVKRLSASGMPERQAEALAESLAEAALGQLATKDDIRSVREEMATKDDIRSVREEIRQVRGEIRVSKGRVLARFGAFECGLLAEVREGLREQRIWFFAMQVALVSAAFALMKVLS